jgi:hypothetical protein
MDVNGTECEASPIYVCVDCAMVIANGENEYPSPEAEAEHDEGMARHMGDHVVTLGHVFTEDEQRQWDAGEEVNQDLEFSWRQCGGCGSNLGGSRHAATLWLNERYGNR